MNTSEASLADVLGSADWVTTARERRAEIVRRLGEHRDVLLFGAGDLGRQVRRDLGSLPFHPLAFVDNNAGLWGTELDGLEVIAPPTALERYGRSALWLITIYTNRQVSAQCSALGVTWVTCAEFSWQLPEPHPPSFDFGLPEDLAAWAPQIAEAAGIWADAASAAEYVAQVRWRFMLDYDGLARPRPMSQLYFPEDIVRSIDDEVFVDCGAFTGNTIEAFLTKRSGRYAQIIAVEPDEKNCRILREGVSSWGVDPATVLVEPVAVGASRGKLPFEVTGTVASRMGTGGSEVDVAPLDELLADIRPTYIKFDIEGAEHDAIVGGAAVIKAHMPVLAVCLYHKPEDVWDLPLLVQSIAPQYRFFMRRYSEERWETVLYAVPSRRLMDAALR